MPVLVSPIWEDWPVPPLGPQRYGYLVFFRLDTEASVRQLNDADASRAAALLPRDWYLGLVLANGGAQLENAEGDELLNFKFCVLGEGLPELANNSIPIAPAPQVRDDRPPIELGVPLPWSNLYVHTLVNAGGVVTRIHHGTGTFGAVLPEGQQDWVFDCNFADVVIHTNAVLSRAADNAAPVSSPAPDPAPDNDQRSNAHGSDSGASTVSFDVESIVNTYNQVRVHVEIWLDPSSYPGPLAVPNTWLDTLTRLKQIWSDWYERRIEEVKTMGTRKASEWVQTIGEARPLPDAAPLDTHAAESDGPEDRILAHRLERGPGSRSKTDFHLESDGLSEHSDQAQLAAPVNSGLDESCRRDAEKPTAAKLTYSDEDAQANADQSIALTGPPVNATSEADATVAAQSSQPHPTSVAASPNPRKTVRKVAKLPAKIVRGMLSSLHSTIAFFKTKTASRRGG